MQSAGKTSGSRGMTRLGVPIAVNSLAIHSITQEPTRSFRWFVLIAKEDSASVVGMICPAVGVVATLAPPLDIITTECLRDGKGCTRKLLAMDMDVCQPTSCL